jgi:hypothetical protein
MARLTITRMQAMQEGLQQQRVAETAKADDERMERYRHAGSSSSWFVSGKHACR